MQKLKLIGLAALAVLVLTVLIQNRQQAEIHLLFKTISMSQAVSLLAALGLGFALGMLAAARMTPKRKKS